MPSDAPTLRPMAPEDAAAVDGIARRAFTDLEERLGGPVRPAPPRTPEALAAALGRIRHLASTDPGGAWIAERDGVAIGAALALRREGLWGLSLLVVDPGVQSGRVGGRLLAEALAYGDGARGGVILASEDPRALRLYAKAGFALHPVLEASGIPRRLEPPPGVRPGGPADLALAERVDRAVRGAAHGPDLLAALAHGQAMLVAPERGYALVSGSDLRLLAAEDDEAAQALLRAFLAGVAPGERAMVDWVGSAQQWALPVLLEAGLGLRTGGAVFLRGEVGPFTPYLPSGAYL
jgi:GNAT superfamily N-acetyltransferase